MTAQPRPSRSRRRAAGRPIRDARSGSHRRKRRWLDYPRHGRSGPRRWFPSWRLVSGTLLACAAAIAGLGVAVYLYVDIPDQNAEMRHEANVYYWADGSHMVSVGSVNRRNVPLSQVPRSVRDAVLAAENADFYSDSGVSVGGMARAIVNMARGQETQGGSTITQQYVKNTYLTQDQTLSRKVQELAIALKLDNRTSKDDILQGYLNTSWFGRGAYGIQAASNAYYGVDVSRLNPSQGAFLAALLKGGNEFDPFQGEAQRHRAEERWAWILDREVELGMMTRAERARYTEFPVPRRQTLATSLGGQTGYLVDLARRYVKKRTGLTDTELDRGGHQIHTTFEKDAMRRLGRSVEDALRDIRPARRAKDRHVQVGAASVRPGDGAIVAVHGGADALKQFSNNADTAGVPAGSVFKPFVLAAGMQYGVRTENGKVARFLPESYYDATGEFRMSGMPVIPDSPGTAAVPAPSTDFPTLRQALVSSSNVTFRRLGADTGLKQVQDLAVDAGMLRDTMAPLDEEFPLGTSSPSAIRVATAYATFADGGTRHEPYSVTKVLRRGELLPGFSRPRGSRAMDEFVARQMTSVLRDAAADTTGPGGRFAGMSTGDRETQRVAWFAGYGDDLATAVTLFRAEPGKAPLPLAGTGGTGRASAQRLPGRIWTTYMEAMSR
ncbi:transglycosylase domain-containing protein [Streptomyces sp. NPDC057301]|uniref:transglycosylase domain-containing protein n=1 Tax=Streptomyces sp. NPDC057301 TaxID=3346093 RepID=UPI003631E088